MEHLDLLQAIQAGENDGGAIAGTVATGRHLLELWQRRGGAHFWQASAPWQGTSPYAEELRDLGLIRVDVGTARFHAPGQAAGTAEQYWLFLTPAGRKTLQEANEES